MKLHHHEHESDYDEPRPKLRLPEKAQSRAAKHGGSSADESATRSCVGGGRGHGVARRGGAVGHGVTFLQRTIAAFAGNGVEPLTVWRNALPRPVPLAYTLGVMTAHAPEHLVKPARSSCLCGRRAAILLGFVSAVTACGGAAEPSIRHVLDATTEAAAQRDPAQLSRWIVRDDGTPCSPEELRELAQRAGNGFRQRLLRATSNARSARFKYEYILGDGTKVMVWQQGGMLRIGSVPHAEPCASEVARALDALAATLRTQYLGADGNYSPPSYLSLPAQEQWVLEVRTWMEGLAHSAELDVEEVGPSALVRLPTGRIIQLSKEQGCWKVESMK